MNRRGFICAGCWTVDRIKRIDLWPQEEELARIDRVERRGGGSAHNVAIDIRKLDPTMPVTGIGMLGSDDDGRYLRQRAERYLINTEQLHCNDQLATSYTDVMSVRNTGRRTFFHYPGSNDLLAPEHFDFSNRKEKIMHAGLLSLHAELDREDDQGNNGWSVLLKAAQQAGLKTSIEMVSIDPDRNYQLIDPCLPFIDYLIVNDHEIGSVAQCQTINNGITDVKQCLEAAHLVMSRGSMEFVVVHYPAGAICVNRAGETLETRSLPMPQSLIESAVGAGDAFVSGMLYGLHENWSLAQALDLAHCVAVASLRSMTTTGSVESIDGCRQFANELLG